MASTVQLVEINVYEGMTPLVSAYLQSYACARPHLAEAYRFDKYTTCRKVPPGDILADLMKTRADVYAFSSYVWNIGIIKTLLPPLMESKPDATFVLGGPQVMHHADRYLDPENERILVCNGEGERTFSALLEQLLEPRPGVSRVRGLTFHRDRQLVTTEREERIQDLEEIPSPFLTGVIEPGYRMSVIETNRGCPSAAAFATGVPPTTTASTSSTSRGSATKSPGSPPTTCP